MIGNIQIIKNCYQSYLGQNLTIKDNNPRLLCTKFATYKNQQTNESINSYQVSVSSSMPLEPNFSHSLANHQWFHLISNRGHLPELYLLQALLNQDFEQFSSDEEMEIFGEDNTLLTYSKKEVGVPIILCHSKPASYCSYCSDKFHFV